MQGLGNVEYYFAKYLQEAGAIIIGIAERDGTVWDPKGLDIEDIKGCQTAKCGIQGYNYGTFLENSMELLTYHCDILVPAALENQITRKNASAIQVKFIAEPANGPVTREGKKIILEKG